MDILRFHPQIHLHLPNKNDAISCQRKEIRTIGRDNSCCLGGDPAGAHPTERHGKWKFSISTYSSTQEGPEHQCNQLHLPCAHLWFQLSQPGGVWVKICGHLNVIDEAIHRLIRRSSVEMKHKRISCLALEFCSSIVMVIFMSPTTEIIDCNASPWFDPIVSYRIVKRYFSLRADMKMLFSCFTSFLRHACNMTMRSSKIVQQPC